MCEAGCLSEMINILNMEQIRHNPYMLIVYKSIFQLHVHIIK